VRWSPREELPFLFAARTISFFGTNLAPIAVAFAVLGDELRDRRRVTFAAWTLAQISTLLIGGVWPTGCRAGSCDLVRHTNMVVRFTMGSCFSVDTRPCGADRAASAGGSRSPSTRGIDRSRAGDVPDRLLQQANGYMAIARYARSRSARSSEARSSRPSRRGHCSSTALRTQPAHSSSV